MQKRDFLKLSAAGGLMSLVPEAVRVGAWAAGSDAPEKKEVKIGFIPLTDCSSVVMASVMEFDKKYGIKIVPSKEASWAAVRDKLVNGEIDASHVLYGLIYGVQMGIGGPKKDMNILMNLNHNGQAFTLSRKLYDKGVRDGASLSKLIHSEKAEYTFAQTFPTGTHAMWIYYWLAAHGIHPFQDVKAIVDAAVAGFDELQGVRAQLAEANLKLSERKLIERAKGLLMKSRGLDEEAAFAFMRKSAMDRKLKLGDLAQRIIDAAELIDGA